MIERGRSKVRAAFSSLRKKRSKRLVACHLRFVVGNTQPEIIHIPSDFIAAFAPWMRGDLLGDKMAGVVFDNTKIKRFVPGFVVTTTVEQGFRQSLAWFEADPKRCTIDEEWNRLLDKIIDAYETGLKLAEKV